MKTREPTIHDLYHYHYDLLEEMRRIADLPDNGHDGFSVAAFARNMSSIAKTVTPRQIQARLDTLEALDMVEPCEPAWTVEDNPAANRWYVITENGRAFLDGLGR